MKKNSNQLVYLTLLLAIIIGCKEEFNPNIDPANTNLLVVEGFISTNGEKSEIKLSRTRNLGDRKFNIEPGALLELKGEDSGFWQFTENVAGTYSLSANLPINQQYRLRIRLRNNEEYESDLMQPLVAPEIADVTWRKSESGVSIRVNTQGSAENQFFLWQFEEDWLFRSALGTFYRYFDDIEDIEEVTPETSVSICWNENRVQRIAIENAASFSQNNILDKEITMIPNLSEKLGIRYSILVKQIAIDREAFNFWEIIRKNTDDIGGFFSPLPSLIDGNIKMVGNKKISAIGYVSMGVVSEKRIFISSEEVAPWPVNIPEYFGCVIRPDTIAPREYPDFFKTGDLMPVNPIFGETSPYPIAFQAAERFCVDCRDRGGSIVKPDFWED